MAEVVGQVLGRIFSVGKTIYDLCQQSKSNREECVQLQRFIDQISLTISCLDGQPSKEMIDHLTNIVDDLEEACKWLEDFSKRGSVMAVIQASAYKTKFDNIGKKLKRSIDALMLWLQMEARRDRQESKGWSNAGEDDSQWKKIKAEHFIPWNIREIAEGEVTRETLLSESAGHDLFVGSFRSFTVLIKDLKGELKTDQKEITKEFKSECETMKKYQHPNIVLLYGICMANEGTALRYSLVMEYCELGTLREVLQEEPDLLWEKRLSMVLNATMALDCLHFSEGDSVLHGSLSSRKFLVNASYILKLSGFGFSKTESSMRRNRAHRQEEPLEWAYFAPEVLSDMNDRSKCSEIFSLGVVLYEIAGGKLPLQGVRDISLDQVYPSVCKEVQTGLPASCPSALHDIIQDCLNQDRWKRPTAGEIAKRLKPLLQPTRMETAL